MFLNILKSFLLKNKVTKLLSKSIANFDQGPIKSVGVIFDGNMTFEIDNLVSEFIKQGIEEKNIKVLIFKSKVNRNVVSKFDFFTYKDINLSGEIVNSKVELFLNTDFDLLINYHDFEKAPLVYASYLSKSKFKIGFTTQDKIVNQFMINTNPNNFQLFIDELFKYLKILHKI
jgi:hypothetical protein